jgi:hypothetical protein
MHGLLHNASARNKCTCSRVLFLMVSIILLAMMLAVPAFAYTSTPSDDTPVVIAPPATTAPPAPPEITPEETILQSEPVQEETVTQVNEIAVSEDDKTIAASLTDNGTAAISVASKAEAKAELTPAVVDTLAKVEAPLIIQNTGVRLEMPTAALMNTAVTNAVANSEARVVIGAKAVDQTQQQEIMANTAVGASTGIFEVGGKVVQLTAAIQTATSTETISSFSEPVAVTIDLSDLNLTTAQIGQLTGTRMERNAAGKYVPVALGGTYNATNKTFTFYTDRFSLYTVMQKADLINISMKIGDRVTMLNGVSKVIDVAPMIMNDRTMVPYRYTGETLGAKVDWDEKTRTVTMTLGAKTLSFVIDKTSPGMDVPATIVNNRTLVPIRYISEAFGAQVNWIAATRNVQVFK